MSMAKKSVDNSIPERGIVVGLHKLVHCES